jgi:hypothetical protein
MGIEPAAFAFVHLPVDNFTAVNIHEQIKLVRHRTLNHCTPTVATLGRQQIPDFLRVRPERFSSLIDAGRSFTPALKLTRREHDHRVEIDLPDFTLSNAAASKFADVSM